VMYFLVNYLRLSTPALMMQELEACLLCSLTHSDRVLDDTAILLHMQTLIL
jgi:hypothetical protein